MDMKISIRGKAKGMGWVPDYPDFRDYTLESKAIKPMAKEMRVTASAKGGEKLPKVVDLRQWCSLSKIKSLSARARQMQVWDW